MKAPARPYHHGNLREALLEAAEKALESGGAQSISLRELSRELGVSHTSPRRHFVDKQALLNALALRGFERFGEALGRAAKQGGPDFKGRLIKMSRAYVGFALKHPTLLSLMFEAKHLPDAPRELLETSEKAFGRAHAIFLEGQASGEVVPGDAWKHSVVVFSVVQGLVSISDKGKFKGMPLDRLVGDVIERILLGLNPRP